MGRKSGTPVREFSPEEIRGLLKFLIESLYGADDEKNDFANDEDAFNEAIRKVDSLSARKASDIENFFYNTWNGISPIEMLKEDAIKLARDHKVILSDVCLGCFKQHYKLKYHRIIKSFEKNSDAFDSEASQEESDKNDKEEGEDVENAETGRKESDDSDDSLDDATQGVARMKLQKKKQDSDSS